MAGGFDPEQWLPQTLERSRAARLGADVADPAVVAEVVGELVLSLDPPAPPDVTAAARRLRYRELCLVALVIDGDMPFPDNWIYLHDPGVRAAYVGAA